MTNLIYVSYVRDIQEPNLLNRNGKTLIILNLQKTYIIFLISLRLI